MATKTPRKFSDSPGRRVAVPVFVGLLGPSGSGKTYSGLRLCKGIERVTGKPTFVIDTENGRANHYADTFDFRHVPFEAPFRPGAYVDALEYCVARGAGQILVDSASHEHEGEGGVLQWQEEEMARLAALWKTTEDKAKMAAWIKPKADRRKLILYLQRLPPAVAVVMCFRAKEKTTVGRDGKPIQQGYMPIAAPELAFEMTARCLLPPGADGVPDWSPEFPGEKAMAKKPKQFEAIFANRKQLDEDHGEAIARWAAGDGAGKHDDEAAVLAEFDAAQSVEELHKMGAANKKKIDALGEAGRGRMRKAFEVASHRVQTSAAKEEKHDFGPPALTTAESGDAGDTITTEEE